MPSTHSLLKHYVRRCGALKVQHVVNGQQQRFYQTKAEADTTTASTITTEQPAEAAAENQITTAKTTDAAKKRKLPRYKRMASSKSKNSNYVTLTQNAEFFPEQYRHMRKFPGHIQPRHYKMDRGQLMVEFTTELEKIAVPIFGIEPPVVDLAMGTKKLKFEILKKATAHFGREIPLAELTRLKTVKDVVTFFVDQVQAEIPPPVFNVPKNVSLFINEHAKRRETMVRKQMVKMISNRKRNLAERHLKRYFPGPTPTLTEAELDMYLRIFRRNVDDQIFKKKLMTKYNPRKRTDTRISYDRPVESETRDVFASRVGVASGSAEQV